MELFGQNFPADITTASVTISGPGIAAGVTLTGITAPVPDPNSTFPEDMVISGTIPLAHSTFTALLSDPAIIFDY